MALTSSAESDVTDEPDQPVNHDDDSVDSDPATGTMNDDDEQEDEVRSDVCIG